MGYDKRRWARMRVSERRTCETPGCETIARDRCARGGCGEFHCAEHKPAHTVTHTEEKRQAAQSAPVAQLAEIQRMLLDASDAERAYLRRWLLMAIDGDGKLRADEGPPSRHSD